MAIYGPGCVLEDRSRSPEDSYVSPAVVGALNGLLASGAYPFFSVRRIDDGVGAQRDRRRNGGTLAHAA